MDLQWRNYEEEVVWGRKPSDGRLGRIRGRHVGVYGVLVLRETGEYIRAAWVPLERTGLALERWLIQF